MLRLLSCLDPSLDVSQYAHTAWKIREGFATGTIHEIAQTPDGYLWLATESGLLRFDGVRTVPWQPPGEHLPSNDIRSLVAGRDGTLWLGTAKGLVSWKHARLAQFPQLSGFDVYTLLQDHEGTIWAAGVMWEAGLSQPGKLCAIKGGDVHCDGSDGTFSFGVTAAYEDSRGNLWLGAGNGIWRWRPGSPDHYELPAAKQSSLPALVFNRNALVEGERGSLLVAGPGGLRQLIEGEIKGYSFPPGPSASPQFNEPGTLLRDRNGGLWIGTLDRGILHVHEGRADVYSQSDGLTGNAVESFFEDREGNVWVSTTAGLDRFREYAIPTISVKQGLSSPFVVCVLAAKDGSVWLGTTDGLNRWKDGQVTTYRKRPAATAAQSPNASIAAQDPAAKNANAIQYVALPGDYIDSLYQDAQGRIWVATHQGLGYFENGRFIPFSAMQITYAIPITGDNSGNVWAASTEQGLCRLRVGEAVECTPWTKLGSRGSFSDSLVVDPVRGGFWLGFWRGGVVYFKDGEVRASFGTANGLGGGRVNALKLDPDSTLWAATDGGLSRIKDGHIATLTSKNGLPCDTIHDLIDDDAQSSWLYTACGLVRVARSELDAWAADPQRKIQATVFDSSDGIRSHAGVYYPAPRVAKIADGRLWFLPLDGVSVVDPHRLPFNRLPPPVHVEQIAADGKTYEAVSGLRLPPRVRDLSIDFTALSFVAPEKVRFRFKLDGQDKDWREVVNERGVHYTNLPAKHYKFRVLACNNSGVWNEEGAVLDFVIPPAWYQTNWFSAACGAAFLGMIWGIHQLRVRQLAAQFNVRLEERVSERTRIARDLHDTLLQSFQGLVFRFQAARYQLPDRPAEAAEALDSALTSADQAIAEGRGAIQELRSGVFKESNIEQMLLAMGRELASSQDGGENTPSLRVIVEGNRRAKRAMIREEVYRIARELLRNAYRHAQARNIEVELRYDAAAFLLVVRDDGKGIDPKILKEHGRAGHWGLPGMYERAEGIGARLDIWSEAGAGTEVRLTAPAAIAYEKPGDSGRFKLFRKKRIYEHRS